MAKYLPFTLLILCSSVFGLAWILIESDPEKAPWYVFGGFILLLFMAIFCLLGLTLYFIRTRFYKRYSANWYFATSFKMAFFVALFVAVAALLAILKLVTLFNIVLAIAALVLFAVWSYLGKKN